MSNTVIEYAEAILLLAVSERVHMETPERSGGHRGAPRLTSITFCVDSYDLRDARERLAAVRPDGAG